MAMKPASRDFVAELAAKQAAIRAAEPIEPPVGKKAKVVPPKGTAGQHLGTIPCVLLVHRHSRNIMLL